MASDEKDYSKLKKLLEEQESFPTSFTLKFIGLSSEAFKEGVREFEKRYPFLESRPSRESGAGKFLAMTYVFMAADADQIILVMKAAGKIPDVRILL